MTETPTYPFLQVAVTGSVATVTLDRPDVHNAFNAALIASLTAVFRDLGTREDLRAIVLSGAGPSFCAGADLTWMRASLDWSREENLADAAAPAELFAAVNACPCAVIGRIHGAALGGGAGLVACCDIALAADTTRFGFSEVKLGIIPATISPFVIAKIGAANARALFLTGERIDATRAQQIGLVQRIVPAAELDAAIASTLKHLRTSGIQAIRAAKQLALRVPTLSPAEAKAYTINALADIRVTPEAQEGLIAFLEKRPAAWVEEA